MNRPSIGRAHLSIGEVLSLLQDEFPDVTISKIRFLESQGLLDPERTPSGYRKFYEYDIERLRWILRLQKDHYLPLKVIKDRLDEAGGIPPADLAEMAGMGDDGSPSSGTGSGPGSGSPGSSEADGDVEIQVETNGSGTLFARADGTGSGRVAVTERTVRVVAPPTSSPPAQNAAAAASAPTPPAGQPAVQVPSARSGTGGAEPRRPAPTPASRPAGAPAQPSSPAAPAARSSGGGTGGSGAAPARSRNAPNAPAQPQQRPAAPPAPTPAPASGPSSGRAPVRRPPQPGSGSRATQPPRSRQAQRPAASRNPSRQPAPAPRSEARPEPSFGGTGPDTRPLAGVGFEAGADAVSLTLEELAEASGLTLRDIRDLERYGLVEPRDGADGTQYDGDALIVARTAAGFLQHGIEARHMRSYKVAVDREVGMFEQIVSPLLKQRNPEARTRATRTVTELIRLGEVMRGVLLRRELRDHIGGT